MLLESEDKLAMEPSVDSLLACLTMRLRMSAAAPTSSLRWNDDLAFFPPVKNTRYQAKDRTKIEQEEKSGKIVGTQRNDSI